MPDTTPVEINDDVIGVITFNPEIQMLGKVTFVKKHWRNLHYLRVSRYVLSFVIAWPVLKKMYFKIKKYTFLK